MEELQRMAVFWLLHVAAAGLVLGLRREASVGPIVGYGTFMTVVGLLTALIVALALMGIGVDPRWTDWIAPVLNGIALWFLLRSADSPSES